MQHSEQSVRIGGLDIKVPLGIGTLQWGTTALDETLMRGGRITEDTALAIVKTLVEGGVRFFDTAEGYGGGTSESRLGRCAARVLLDHQIANESRETLVLGTKFLPTLWRWSHFSFEAALRASLKRIGQERCDIYFLHSPVHPRGIEFWVEAAAICAKKGLLQSMGLSNCNADQVRRAVAAGKRYGVRISCNQIMFSLLDYKSPVLQETVQACQELDVMVIAYSPIGQGLLTDKLTQESFESNRIATMTRISWDCLAPLREEVSSIARAHGKTMAQVAMNWCICHKTIPLVGCRTVKQAQDSLGCLGWRLSEDEVRRLDQVSLARSTLDSPTWRRSIFVFLAGVLMTMYRFCMFVERVWGLKFSTRQNMLNKKNA